MPAPPSGDALDRLAEAVDHLIEAAERSKRQESVDFWGCIERARAASRAARLEMRRSAAT